MDGQQSRGTGWYAVAFVIGALLLACMANGTQYAWYRARHAQVEILPIREWSIDEIYADGVCNGVPCSHHWRTYGWFLVRDY
jgi:hypothetical protein